jgi:predicted O-methyltransferase YrrM
LTDRISGIKGDSYEVLFEMMKENKKFDFIYIDGSHLSFDCYSDLMISWRLLVRGGVLAIDDYLYNAEGAVVNSPFEGVNHFLKKHQNEIKILHKGYRVFLTKV